MADIYDEKILILDFGSQTTQLIARRIRETKVYCEIYPYTMSLEKIKAFAPKGIIFSGGPASIYSKNAPILDSNIFTLGIPILGICYGMQIIVHLMGGLVIRSKRREYGLTKINIIQAIGPFQDLNVDKTYQVWMSHRDYIKKMPVDFIVLAATVNSPIAAIGDPLRRLYGILFHPELIYTLDYMNILANFVLYECDCRPLWTMQNFIEATVTNLKKKLGNKKVICALSGGVDSSVVALLLHRAVSKNLVGIFVDNGLLRSGEVNEVVTTLSNTCGINLRVIDASAKFLYRLKGITNPEEKRRIIGYTFIEIFEAEANIIGEVEFLAQGTLYPDVIESISYKGPSSVIKTHHNVGGLPEKMQLRLVEPLRDLFKDECREVGRELGLPEAIINRQPFPGPGLAVRIIGEVTAKRLLILRQADTIVYTEMHSAGLYYNVWQSFAVLLTLKTVGVMGDERTYENVIALRIVDSIDAMTANWSRIPYEVLACISSRIINEVNGINRVVFDISTKPPATIEWE